MCVEQLCYEDRPGSAANSGGHLICHVNKQRGMQSKETIYSESHYCQSCAFISKTDEMNTSGNVLLRLIEFICWFDKKNPS